MKIQILYSFTFLLFSTLVFGQNKNVTNKLLSSTFETATDTHTHRPVLSIKNKKTISKLNPLLYLGVGMMYFYQNVISEQIQADCTYMMSCSEFTKKSIEKKGFAKGTLLGFNQLYNCFPGAVYERSEYLINSDSKVNNILDEEN